MTGNHCLQKDLRECIHTFVVAAENNELTEDHWINFERLLCESDEACRLYAEYMDMSLSLSAIVDTLPDEGSSSSSALSLEQQLRVSSTLGGFLGTVCHGTIGFFSQELPFSLLIATVLTGLGLWFGSMIYVSSPEKIAKDSLPPSRSAFTPALEIVAKITGMVDCQWSKDGREPAGFDAVLLGRQFKLDSGVMEITYKSGAKVILQGPATYEVESKTGGFMSFGKLTGKMEVEKAKGFTVRTPTAIVTDLGTEFGVEVSKDGRTTSHVFRGSVSLQAIATDGASKPVAKVLFENESAHVEKSNNTDGMQLTVLKSFVDTHFVRSLPPSKSLSPDQVLAWFRMGEDDHNAVDGHPVGEKTINRKGRWHLNTFGSPLYTRDTTARDSSLAVRFSGTKGEYFYSKELFASPNDYFILEAWVRPQSLGSGTKYVSYNGRPGENGYGLIALNGRWACLLGQVGILKGVKRCHPGKWTHLALVCERGRVQLWVNGRPDGRPIDSTLNLPNGPFSIGGSVENPESSLPGDIDEVRLSEFRAPFRPEMLLFPSATWSQENDEPDEDTNPSSLIVDTATNWAPGTTATLKRIRSDDLIDNHQLGNTLESVTHTGLTTDDGSSPDGLNDGAGGTLCELSHANTWSKAGEWTTTFTLKTDVNTAGYDIREIRSFTGWLDVRVHQQYEVLYSTVKAPNRFISLGIFSDTSHTNGSLMMKITRDKGVIASGVKAIRFDFTVPMNPSDSTVYQEIDVLGKPTAMSAPAATATK